MDLDPRLGRGSGSGKGAASASAGSTTPSPSNRPGSGDEEGSEASPAAGGDDGGPRQGGGAEGDGDADGEGEGDANAIDPKKLRACESCRGLKVRCEPDPNEGPCKRCKKAGRKCVVTAPTRKRQKKTDSRVSELEKKIDALTASLQARVAPGPNLHHHNHQQHQYHPQQQQYGGSPGIMSPASASTAAQGGDRGRQTVDNTPGNEHRRWDKEIAPLDQRGTAADNDSPFQQLITMAGKKRKAIGEQDTDSRSGGPNEDRKPSTTAAAVGWPAYTSKSSEGDVVDRGLVPADVASELFSRYKSQMVRHLPGIVFPPSTTVAELRRTKPILFLSIMAAASGENHPLQRVLQKELMQIFAERVIVIGEKSLELVQALNVAVIWYWPPEHFEELKFYQLIHIAAVMALDIGLGRRPIPRGSRGGGPMGGGGGSMGSMGFREHVNRRNPPPDPTSIESRRTWLTCYYLAANTAMSLHRPNLIRWTPFMAECMEVLETSPDAAPTDKYFCHLVWTHHLGEQIGTQFSMDDPVAVVNIADPRTQYTLRALERDLERYIATVPQERMQATLRLGFDLLNLYMHEGALNADAATEQLRPPYGEEALQEGIVRDAPLSAAHVNALTACLSAINGIFTTFLNLEVTSIRCLPVFNFVRVAYAVVVLMKMYFSASTADSELGHVFTRESMRVQYYLDALLDKFRATAADDKCRPASKFLVVLAMLRSWFVKQGRAEGGNDGKDDGSGNAAENTDKSNTNNNHGQQQQNPQPQQQQPQTANTPLQLLSEVATGRESSYAGNRHNSASSSSYNNYYNRPQQQHPQQQQQAQYASYTGTPTSTSASTGTAPAAAGADGNTGMTPLPLSNSDDPSVMFPSWISQAMMSGNDFDTASASVGMGMGGGFAGFGGMGYDPGLEGMRMTANDQFFSDMFQGLPDNIFPGF